MDTADKSSSGFEKWIQIKGTTEENSGWNGYRIEKNSVSQLVNSEGSLASRVDQLEQGISGLDNKVEELTTYYDTSFKTKHIQELWDTIKGQIYEV